MKNLAFICNSRNTAAACTEQLRNLLRSAVNINAYAIEETLPAALEADFALFASREAYSTASSCVKRGVPKLIARRSINYHYVDKLFAIPAGSDVMLVNDHISSATETIALLQTLGINHINYHPYAPQMQSVPRLKTAVTPGESQYVPPFVETVIDIRTRLIDITTIAEMLHHLNLLSVYADFLSANYLQDIIALIKSGYEDVNEIQRLEGILKQKHQREQKIAKYTLANVVGKSPAILSALELARKMSASHSSILIQGESGTGKEIIAQGIHNASPRSSGPFIAVNFAALSDTLLESELFGYLPGAFTGANRHGATGLFEEADNGTLFLDEIGDAPLSFQVKLLRVLQERQIRRIGSYKVIPINVRVIAATNRDLKKLIAEGKFRRDLYYRLNILPIELPPLRERGGDILLLAAFFYQKEAHGRLFPAEYFSKIADCLLSYSWPGNIRELQNVVEYLVTLSPDKAPEPSLLPQDMQRRKPLDRQEDRSDSYLKNLIFEEIESAAQSGRGAGRRSLAERLHLPENRVRHALHELAKEGKISVGRGRGGVKLKKTSEC